MCLFFKHLIGNIYNNVSHTLILVISCYFVSLLLCYHSLMIPHLPDRLISVPTCFQETSLEPGILELTIVEPVVAVCVLLAIVFLSFFWDFFNNYFASVCITTNRHWMFWIDYNSEKRSLLS